MATRGRFASVVVAATLSMLGALSLTAGVAMAHCDGLDGPVVTAARKALDKKDVTGILIWVQKKDEAEVLQAFAQTVAVRKLSPQARELADTYFFETLVRLHRAGEGAPYDGLKPAGRDLGPAIPAADAALASGDVEALVKLLTNATEKGVREHFAEARAARNYPADNVAAGRRYVGAYVPFIHYVERLYESATTSAHGHQEVIGEAVQHHE